MPEYQECGQKNQVHFFADMADIVDTQTRSRMMSGIGHENTGPEAILQREFGSRGYEFDTHRRDLPGKPDLIFPEFQAVIQVHGCFWHHHDCSLFKWPKTREKFWRDKIERNEIRDSRNLHLLKVADWRVLIIWECAVKRRKDAEVSRVIDCASKWLESRSEYLEIPESRNF